MIIAVLTMANFLPQLKSISKSPVSTGLSVLLVGNNPLEMSSIYEQLKSLKEKVTAIYISFNEQEALKFISSNHPNCVLIDDNYGKSAVNMLLSKLKAIKNPSYTLTLLKTKNTADPYFGFQDYLMKEGISAERLYSTLKNSINFKNKFQKLQVRMKVK